MKIKRMYRSNLKQARTKERNVLEVSKKDNLLANRLPPFLSSDVFPISKRCGDCCVEGRTVGWSRGQMFLLFLQLSQ
jgi:hypothetical protein